MIDDRAERASGLLAAIKAAVARALAEDPAPPIAWSPPRGLAELNGLLDQVRSASSRTVGPGNPKAKLSTGYEYRTIAAHDWAQAAKLDPDVARVAWALASEAPPIAKYPQYAWAIGEAVCNAGVRMVTRDKRMLVDGHFGRQGGRWCASFQPPTGQHVRCAELLLGRHVRGAPNILAAGATQWTDQDTQHLIHTKALKDGDLDKAARNPTPEVVMRRRYASGQKWIGPVVDVLGTVVLDPWVLTLLGPVGAHETQAMAMLADGRRRWKRRA